VSGNERNKTVSGEHMCELLHY